MTFKFSEGFGKKLCEKFDSELDYLDVNDYVDKKTILSNLQAFLESQVQLRLEEMDREEMREIRSKMFGGFGITLDEGANN
jgi:hypothetical protein